MEELLRRCSGGGGSKDRGRAAWSLCLLLFSAKTATSPMYSALANQFDGKVAFGEVRGALNLDLPQPETDLTVTQTQAVPCDLNYPHLRPCLQPRGG